MTGEITPPAKPSCPHCLSTTVVPANCRTIILTGVGGILGSLLTILIMFSDKDSNKKGQVGSVIVGTFSGASAGFRFGQSMAEETAGRTYLCLDCFHFFTLPDTNRNKEEL